MPRLAPLGYCGVSGNIMKQIFAISVAVVLTGCSSAGIIDKPLGVNCDLQKPPVDAGEIVSEGVFFKIYPRTNDIDDNYNGCQVTWVESDGWHVITLALISNGDIARLWAPNIDDPEQLNCSYSREQMLKGNAEKCHKQASVYLKSLRAGCVERVGTTFRNTHGCEYE